MQEEIKSHKQILKSTSIVGGSQIATIFIGIFRTKVLAVLLGPLGIGYIGVLQNIIDLIRQTTGFGINFSAIKDVAESNASNNITKISTTIKILKQWAFWTGILGTLMMLIFCISLSKYSFGDASHAMGIAFIAVTILIMSVSGGQLALLQGLRKINQMAKATFYGAILGTVITLPLYWFLGIDGIVPGMILTALGNLILSWWFTKEIQLEKITISFRDTVKGGAKMVSLGFFITITGIMATVVLYIVRSFLLKKMNIDTVGCFQACWMIATLYLGIILNAMLADFFPRLTEVNTDNLIANRLINEQLEIAFLFATPMIVGIIVFADLIIKILYSAEFIPAIPVLRWLISGTFFTIISWPLGVLFLAKNKGVFSFITEGIWNILFLAILYLSWDYFKFETIGYAYVIACFVRFVVVYFCTIHLSNFKFTKINLIYLLVFGVLVIMTMCNVIIVSGYFQYALSFVLILITLSYSYIHLNKILDIRGLLNEKIGKYK